MAQIEEKPNQSRAQNLDSRAKIQDWHFTILAKSDRKNCHNPKYVDSQQE